MKQNHINVPDPQDYVGYGDLNHHRQVYELIERGFRTLDVNMTEIERRLTLLTQRLDDAGIP